MFRLTVIAAVGLLLAGCSNAGSSSAEAPRDGGTLGGERVSVSEGRPDIAGVITEIKDTPGAEARASKRLLIEENPGECSKSKSEEGCDRLYLDATGETRILKELGGEGVFVRAGVADLARGQKVRAWHTGVLTKSYPAQGTARVIVIDGADLARGRTTRDRASLR
jgi:hypothetical protein